MLPYFIFRFQIDTSYQLPWLKGIETSHGSVAKSSLLDAQAINGMGLYRVGYPNQDGNTATGKLTLDEVIQLIVPQGESGEQKYYSLDDLRDLQSKLMLIAAKALHGKEEVDRFVDVSSTSLLKDYFCSVIVDSVFI